MTAIRPVPREAALVVNAHSRKGQALFEEARDKLVAAGIKLVATYPVRDPGKLIETMREAVASGAPMVIVGGGDGTLSCTVDDVVERDCVFALLPFGTANSFARTLGLDFGRIQFTLDLDGAVETIATGRRLRIDLGMIDGDYFANCAVIGLPSVTREGVAPSLKKYLGRFGYVLGAMWTAARFRPFLLTVEDGKETHKVWATEVRIANGRFHGGVEMVEEASLHSGEIIVQAVTGKSRFRLFRDWFARYWRLAERDAMTEEFSGKRLRIDTRPRQKISIDGEVLAKTPATVEAAGKAIEVVVPAIAKPVTPAAPTRP